MVGCAEPRPECVNVIPRDRVPCGRTIKMDDPLSEEECLQHDDCCYDNTNKDARKWCYQKGQSNIAIVFIGDLCTLQ